MDFIVAAVILSISAGFIAASALPALKILQLSGYKARGCFAYFSATGKDMIIRYFAMGLLSAIAVIVFVSCFSAYFYVRYCAAVLFLVLSVVFVVTVHKKGDDKVVWTARLKRLFALVVLLVFALVALSAYLTYEFSLYYQVIVCVVAAIVPFMAILANWIMLPVERANNNRYIKRAKSILAEKHPTVIGITGSFGKTTVKNMLAAMLAKRFKTLATPSSYNTPLGVCKTINQSLDDAEFFVAELGARYKGDIAELCDIVKPTIGIITAIGDMHLESFGTKENIANTKYELAQSLDSSGVLILNGYNAACKELLARNPIAKTLVTADNSVVYDNLNITTDGTRFDLVAGDKRVSVKTALLGAHVAELGCLAAAAAIECGVPIEDTAAALSEMPPVEHRLSVVKSTTEITVLDDAYNSNPVGAKNALDVLSRFDGKKIIITPGFVELGAIEKTCNTELGRNIAAVCDYAFLVGTRAADIKRGAVDGGMLDACVSTFDSRDDAVEALKDISGKRVILFENDLPDNIK